MKLQIVWLMTRLGGLVLQSVFFHLGRFEMKKIANIWFGAYLSLAGAMCLLEL